MAQVSTCGTRRVRLNLVLITIPTTTIAMLQPSLPRCMFGFFPARCSTPSETTRCGNSWRSSAVLTAIALRRRVGRSISSSLATARVLRQAQV